jgi:uncharacterized protein involved in cysteine biosynthesis
VLRAVQSVNLSPVQPTGTAAASFRPGFIRRAGAGAWQVPAAMVLVFRTPALWPLGLPLAALGSAGLVGGLVAGAYAFPWAERLTGLGPSAHWLVGFAFTSSLLTSALAVGIAAGFGAVLVLAAPLSASLCSRAEAGLGGPTRPPISAASRWRGAWLLIAAAPAAALLALVPVLSPALVILSIAAALAVQATAAPLSTRGLGLAARRTWHRQWLAESAGFGLASAAALLAPGINLFLAPTLPIAGTRLVLELGTGAPPALPGRDEGPAPGSHPSVQARIAR